jgi:hypothetical protein
MLRQMGIAAVLVALVGTALPTYAVAQDLEIGIQVSPKVLNLSSAGTWVTIHADVPYADVLSYGVAIDGVNVPVARDKADLMGNLVIKLKRTVVDSIVAPGVVSVVVAGVLADGTAFAGDTDLRVRGEANRCRERHNR